MTTSAPAIDNRRVKLLGLDFGSTTCSAMVAEAYVTTNSVTGRMEFSEPIVIFRSAPVFTPFINHAIDAAAVATLISGWLEQSGLALDEVSGVRTLTMHLPADGKVTMVDGEGTSRVGVLPIAVMSSTTGGQAKAIGELFDLYS